MELGISDFAHRLAAVDSVPFPSGQRRFAAKTQAQSVYAAIRSARACLYGVIGAHFLLKSLLEAVF